MPLLYNFGAQRLCAFWYGAAYYDGLAAHCAGGMDWKYHREIHKRQKAVRNGL